MGDGTRTEVVFVGTIKLKLTTDHFLELHEVAYIPSIRRNLIFVSILDGTGYSFLFGNGKATLYRDSVLIGNGILCGNLYKLNLLDVSLLTSSSSSLNIVATTKRSRLNEKSSILWH